MTNSRAALFMRALDRSLEVREEAHFDFRSAINIYDLCDQMGITVRFDNEISMEGVSVMMLWLDVSSYFLAHGGPLQLFLGALLAWRARWLVDRLRTTCDIWKPAPTPTARSST